MEITDDEWELFYEQVVPYYGLDTSFQWHLNPSRVREYLQSYARETL